MALRIQPEQRIEPGAWDDALWHQFLNCIDSLRAQAAESSTIPGLGPVFKSHPSIETFEGNVIILEALCEGYGLIDDEYRKKIPEEDNKKTARQRFSALTALLKRKKGWSEDRPYLGRV